MKALANIVEQKWPGMLGLATDALEKRFVKLRDILVGQCESPIEVSMAEALLTCETAIQHVPTLVHPTEPEPDWAGFYICAQRWVGTYRVDFACFVVGKKGEVYRLAVECDGQAFHSSVPDVAADKARDRFLLTAGWPVMRFTGSEIHADPAGCGAQVSQYFAACASRGEGGAS